MKQTLLLFFLMLVGIQNTFNQVYIDGMLVSSEGSGANDVSIVFHPKNDFQQIIAFGFSDHKGHFQIKIDHPQDSIALSVRSLVFRDTVLVLANRSQKIEIHLLPQSHKLAEVRVKGRPIITGKDTTTYLVAPFAQKKDFSIGDVINNMPGFEVSPEGKVLYQGRDIQKYYIEGLDLLESRYPLANKNLPHTSVSAVEVLHNHQPVKAIEGVIASDATSINIKLKRSVALTGTAQTSIGGSPLLWDLNFTPMLFQKKQQVIGSWQTNNTGTDLNLQHQPLVYSGGKIEGITTLKSEFVNIPNISPPNITRSKYFDNRAHLATYNHLVKVASDTEFKVNGSYYRDHISEKQVITTSYFLEDTVLNIYEKQQNALYKSSLLANLMLTRNITSCYLQNKLSFGGFWDENLALINNSGMQQIKAGLHHQTMANHFDLLIPVKKSFLQIESIIDLNKSPQQLYFEPEVFVQQQTPGGNTLQQIHNRNVVTRNKARFGLSLGAFVLSSSLEFEYEKQEHKTGVISNGISIGVDSIKNLLQWSRTGIMLKEELEYKKRGFILNFGLPFQYLELDIIDKIHNASNKSGYWLVKPSLSAQYTPTGSLTGNLLVYYSAALSNPNDLTQGNIIVSHRLTRNNQAETDLLKSISYLTKLTYRNPIIGMFGTLSWNEVFSSKSMMTNQISQGEGVFLYKALRKNNNASFKTLSSEISWYINEIKTTAGLKSRYSETTLDYLLNGELSEMSQKQYSLTPNLQINRFRYWSADFSYNITKSTMQFYQSSSEILEQKHSFNLYIYPQEHHMAGLETEFYVSKRANEKANQTLFSNIVYNYKPSGKRVNLKLQYRNIFNTGKIIYIRESDISLVKTEYYLRPREFLLTVLWSLGKNK